jgi:hypothetical protein
MVLFWCVKLWKRICAETTTEINLLADNWKYILGGLIFQVSIQFNFSLIIIIVVVVVVCYPFTLLSCFSSSMTLMFEFFGQFVSSIFRTVKKGEGSGKGLLSSFAPP